MDRCYDTIVMARCLYLPTSSSSDDGSSQLFTAKACRSSPWKCILFITAGDGWGARAVMDKATFLSMPLAIAVANSAVNYVTIPHFYKSF